MKRTALVLSALLTVAGLSACSTETEPAPTAATVEGEGLPAEVVSMVEGLGLEAGEGADVRQVVDAMDQLDQARPLAVQASVRPGEVVFSQDGEEVAVPIEGEDVYVSIAPYVSQTHDCYYHALGGCQGELAGEDVHVTITADDGEVLVDEDATTYTNGFVGYWLPKDVAGTITITRDGLSGEVPLDTSAEGPTCVTTLQLA